MKSQKQKARDVSNKRKIRAANKMALANRERSRDAFNALLFRCFPA